MTKAEFLKRCHDNKYCDKKTAEEYAKDKTEFSEDDLIAVYRIKYGEKIGLNHYCVYGAGVGRTTKRYGRYSSDGINEYDNR